MHSDVYAPGTDHRHSERGGVVLIAVLTTLLAIFALVIEVNRRSRDEVASMGEISHASELRATASSGIQIAMAILAEDGKKGGTDTVQELWADPEALGEFLSDLSFEAGELDLVITDELGKIQVNALVEYPGGKQFNPQQKALWERLLLLLNRAEDEDLDGLGENVEIVNSMKDWLDFGDGDAITGLTGAEDDHYLSLDDPYPCGNGPMHHIDELSRVKGMSLELLNKSEAGYRIRDFLTVFGAEPSGNKETSGFEDIPAKYQFPGRININTAELPVIFSMMPETLSDLDRKIAAEAIVGFRSDKDESGFLHPLEGEWYKTCPGCENNGIDPKMIRTDSSIFSIASRASDAEKEVILHCVVKRDGEKITTIGWWEGGEPPRKPGEMTLDTGLEELLNRGAFF